jgi:putative Mn2+ efflux pump MntP
MTRQKRKDPLAWGIILIVTGVVILLSNIHITGWDFWEFFARLWPVILILWGLWKLYHGIKEKTEEKRPE